jgi:hypothetical protein
MLRTRLRSNRRAASTFYSRALNKKKEKAKKVKKEKKERRTLAFI